MKPLELQTARSYPVVVLVSAVDRRIIPAVRFVSRLPFAEAAALHVSVDPDLTRGIAEQWSALDLAWLPLHTRHAEDGDIAAAVVAAVEEMAGHAKNVTVVVPELNSSKWWHHLLHRQRARRIAAALQGAPRITVVIVPFTLGDDASA